jgi:pimeloyl-ACP methyl ester carboxylesterase
VGAVCALCMSYGSVFASSQTSPFQFLREPGPYPVGMKVVYQYDRSRNYSADAQSRPTAGDETRPLQTLIWYPSLKSPAKAMTVGDYVRLADTETHFNTPDEKENRWRSLLKTSSYIPLWAVQDAQQTKERYPVLIYAPSDSSVSWENADLCEYVASHGYVVLASPSMGASTRDMTDDLDGITAQARDISFLITYAKTLPNTDLSEVAVVSWSWGGASSLFAAARDPRIDALVSMDGTMRYYPGLVKMAGDVHPERMTMPLLFFTRGDPNVLEDIDRYHEGPAAYNVGPNVLNAWIHGDLLTVNMIGMPVVPVRLSVLIDNWAHALLPNVRDHALHSGRWTRFVRPATCVPSRGENIDVCRRECAYHLAPVQATGWNHTGSSIRFRFRRRSCAD